MPIGDFWCSLQEAKKGTIAKTGTVVLFSLATTNRYESGVSTLVSIKIKTRNRFDVVRDMRLVLSKMTPQLNLLIELK